MGSSVSQLFWRMATTGTQEDEETPWSRRWQVFFVNTNPNLVHINYDCEVASRDLGDSMDASCARRAGTDEEDDTEDIGDHMTYVDGLSPDGKWHCNECF